MASNIIKKIQRNFSRIKRLIKVYICRDRFTSAHESWVKDKGDETHRLTYDLNEASVVFDLGGYEGSFTKQIHERYKSNIYIFEPIPDFFQKIVHRFENNKKIMPFNFGLSNYDGTIKINLNNDGSSVFGTSDSFELIKLKDIVSFIKENDVHCIDLMKINIEGGEFQVIPALIESGLINRVSNLQIQFHTFVKDAIFLRDDIRNKLSETHELTYDYWFIWENWRIKEK